MNEGNYGSTFNPQREREKRREVEFEWTDTCTA